MVNNFYLDMYEHRYDLKMNYSDDDLDDAIVERRKMNFEPERVEIVRSAIMRERRSLEEMSLLKLLRYSLKAKEFKRERNAVFEVAIVKLNHYIKTECPFNSPAN